MGPRAGPRESSVLTHGKRRAQINCSTDVDMLYFCGAACSIDMQQNTDTHAQAAGHGNLLCAHQGYLRPAQPAGGKRRKFSVQVSGDGEDGTCNIFSKQLILTYHQLRSEEHTSELQSHNDLV